MGSPYPFPYTQSVYFKSLILPYYLVSVRKDFTQPPLQSKGGLNHPGDKGGLDCNSTSFVTAKFLGIQ